MLIQLGKYNLLIDMGISCKKTREALNEHNLDFDDVSATFITHTHGDHISGMKVITKYLNGDIYATPITCDCLSDYSLKEIKYDETLEVSPGLFVTCFYTPHDADGSCGFLFKYKNTKIGYATDLGIADDSIIEYLKGSKLVILESNHDVKMLKKGSYPEILKKRILSNFGHLSNENCSKTILELTKYGTKHFMLAHLSKENNRPEIAYKETHDLINDETVDIKVLPIYSHDLVIYE